MTNTSGQTTTNALSDTRSVELAWDKATTPLEAVERALYALADRVTGTIADAGDTWRLTAHPRCATNELSVLTHRLRQEVNDQSLRVRIAERTDPVRNVVFALAFSRTGIADVSQPDTIEGPSR